jgi:hypothetical protein
MLLLSATTFQTIVMLVRFKMCCPSSACRVSPINASLVVWYLGKFELSLFCVYSPAHALLWMVVTQSNWIWVFLIMSAVWVQVGQIAFVLLAYFLILSRSCILLP